MGRRIHPISKSDLHHIFKYDLHHIFKYDLHHIFKSDLHHIFKYDLHHIFKSDLHHIFKSDLHHIFKSDLHHIFKSDLHHIFKSDLHHIFKYDLHHIFKYDLVDPQIVLPYSNSWNKSGPPDYSDLKDGHVPLSSGPKRGAKRIHWQIYRYTWVKTGLRLYIDKYTVMHGLKLVYASTLTNIPLRMG